MPCPPRCGMKTPVCAGSFRLRWTMRGRVLLGLKQRTVLCLPKGPRSTRSPLSTRPDTVDTRRKDERIAELQAQKAGLEEGLARRTECRDLLVRKF
jgi:hypothetical protein